MLADTLSTCEMWDLTRPVLPQRSQLYSLEPVSLGTPDVESLTGYIARLAEAHSVRTRILVVHKLVPLLGRPHLSKPVNSGLSAFWSKDARALNGTRCLASDWVQALESLTLRRDLRFLTLLTWVHVLPSRGLLRLKRAWCPECYEAWRQAGQVIYEPLLWTLEVVRICPYHRRRLSDRCPQPGCQQTSSVLAPRSRPGHCPHCERWLGNALGIQTPEEALSEEEWTWQTWVVDRVGELLASAPGLPNIPTQQNIASVINSCVEQVFQGNGKAFARRMQASNSAVDGWRRQGSSPQLETLLRLCRRFGTSPLRLLTEGAAAVNWSNANWQASLPPVEKPKRQRRPFGAASTRQVLEAVLASDEQPPPPMRQVARRLGKEHSFLYAHFPDLCREISARYMAYQKERGRQRVQQLCDEVRQAAITIHAQDIYPSAYRIESLLSVPGFMRHPAAIAVWREILKELGLAS